MHRFLSRTLSILTLGLFNPHTTGIIDAETAAESLKQKAEARVAAENAQRNRKPTPRAWASNWQAPVGAYFRRSASKRATHRARTGRA